MHCPRCLEEVSGDTCPNCGKSTVEGTSSSRPAPEASGALHVLAAPRPGRPGEDRADWREEIRKKLDRHQLQKEEAGGEADARLRARQLRNRARREAERKKRVRPGTAGPSPDNPEVGRQLFDYRLTEQQPEHDRRIVTFRLKPEQLAKPVIRKRSRPVRKPEAVDRRQRPLELVVRPRSEHPETDESGIPAPPPAGLHPEEPADEREVLFSRVLAGLLDLMIALLTGALFGLVAATVMDSDLTSPAVLEVAGGCAAAFWLLNNSFFLFVSRQTPGMMVTDLVLVPEPRVELGLGRVVGRILLQILAVLSLVGLVWAVFDEQRRCWHDRLSRTLIVPVASLEEAGDEQDDP